MWFLSALSLVATGAHFITSNPWLGLAAISLEVYRLLTDLLANRDRDYHAPD
jgi:hypothetical protein